MKSKRSADVAARVNQTGIVRDRAVIECRGPLCSGVAQHPGAFCSPLCWAAWAELGPGYLIHAAFGAWIAGGNFARPSAEWLAGYVAAS